MSNRTDIVVETDNAEGQVLLSASRVYDLTEDKTQDTINGEVSSSLTSLGNTLNQLEDSLDTEDLGSDTLENIQAALVTLFDSMSDSEFKSVKFVVTPATGIFLNTGYLGDIKRHNSTRFVVEIQSVRPEQFGMVITGIYYNGTWSWACTDISVRKILPVITGTTNNSEYTIAIGDYFVADSTLYQNNTSGAIPIGGTWRGTAVSQTAINDLLQNQLYGIIRLDSTKTKDSLPNAFLNGITLTITSSAWTNIASERGYGIAMTAKYGSSRIFQILIDYYGAMYVRASASADSWYAWSEK